MKRHVLKICLALSGALVVPVSSASAELLIHRAYKYDDFSYFLDRHDSRTWGYSFVLNPVPGSRPDFRVNALGYNSVVFTQNGYFGDAPLTAAQGVGLWDSAGNLLASTMIGPTNFERDFGGFLWNSISPLVLSPGTYVIGGTLPYQRYFPGNATNVVTSPGFTWQEARFGGKVRNGYNPTLAFPNEPGGGDGGTNAWPIVNISVRPVVPEPATWALLLLGFGAIGGVVRARRRQNVSVSYA